MFESARLKIRKSALRIEIRFPGMRDIFCDKSDGLFPHRAVVQIRKQKPISVFCHIAVGILFDLSLKFCARFVAAIHAAQDLGLEVIGVVGIRMRRIGIDEILIPFERFFRFAGIPCRFPGRIERFDVLIGILASRNRFAEEGQRFGMRAQFDMASRNGIEVVANARRIAAGFVGFEQF